MFLKLKQKWKVSWLNFVLIWITFACGGSLCGFLGKKIMVALGWEKGILYWIAYIILITILWPFCVLAISIITQQFSFFKNYIGKLLRRIGGK